MSDEGIQPPTAADRAITANVLGAIDLPYLLLLAITPIILLDLQANYVELASQDILNKLTIAWEIWATGVILRIFLTVFGLLTGPQKYRRKLIDMSIDAQDIVVFTSTISLSALAVILLNVTIPNIYSKFIGLSVMGIGMVVINSENVGKANRLLRYIRGKKKIANSGMLSAILLAPMASVVTFSVQPTTAKLFATVMGVCEEGLFRAGLLPMFIFVLAFTLPFWVAAIVGVMADETIFTAFHAYVYGTVGPDLAIVFASGVVLAIAYLSGPMLGRPARPSASLITHALINYLSQS